MGMFLILFSRVCLLFQVKTQLNFVKMENISMYQIHRLIFLIFLPIYCIVSEIDSYDLNCNSIKKIERLND